MSKAFQASRLREILSIGAQGGVGEDYDTNKTDRTEVLVSRRDWTYCDRDWRKKKEIWWRGILAGKNKAMVVNNYIFWKKESFQKMELWGGRFGKTWVDISILCNAGIQPTI